MARVLSALVLLPLVIGAVWFLPPIATLVLAEIAALLAFVEYAAIARALGAHVPRAVASGPGMRLNTCSTPRTSPGQLRPD